VSSDFVLVLFNLFVVVMLALDLGLFQRSAHFPTMRAALLWMTLWVCLALSFAAFIWVQFDSTRALEFLTGYVVELSSPS
jgi:tellurite resistance protein TerC